MNYDESFERYYIDIDDISFQSEEEPEIGIEDRLKILAKNYWNNLDRIIEFITPELKEMYGNVDAEMVKAKLGNPTIFFDINVVYYYEQSFDEDNTFIFEFLDDEFKSLQYFSIIS